MNATPRFTCSNYRFRTDTDKGNPHGAGREKGSVLDAALFDDGNNSLWLEYVVDMSADPEKGVFWLMWYDKNGTPNLRASPVFNIDQLREMNRQLAAFIEIQ